MLGLRAVPDSLHLDFFCHRWYSRQSTRVHTCTWFNFWPWLPMGTEAWSRTRAMLQWVIFALLSSSGPLIFLLLTVFTSAILSCLFTPYYWAHSSVQVYEVRNHLLYHFEASYSLHYSSYIVHENNLEITEYVAAIVGFYGWHRDFFSCAAPCTKSIATRPLLPPSIFLHIRTRTHDIVQFTVVVPQLVLDTGIVRTLCIECYLAIWYPLLAHALLHILVYVLEPSDYDGIASAWEITHLTVCDISCTRFAAHVITVSRHLVFF